MPPSVMQTCNKNFWVVQCVIPEQCILAKLLESKGHRSTIQGISGDGKVATIRFPRFADDKISENKTKLCSYFDK